MKRNRLNLIRIIIVTLIGLNLSLIASNQAATRPNILFVAFDDLRPETGSYGVKGIKTPNIDRVAAEGILFERAYCQQAVCSPSRTSIMTGKRPDTTKIYDLVTHFRTTIPDTVTLSQHFKENGYVSAAFGKIFHAKLDDEKSWSIPTFESGGHEKGGKKKKGEGGDKGPAWTEMAESDEDLPDGMAVIKAIEFLKVRTDKTQPFFVGLGFKKPHLPFEAPKKYFDLYDVKQMPLPANPGRPINGSKFGFWDFGELRAFSDIPKQGALLEEQLRQLTRAYYACTTYSDAMLGKMLDYLKEAGLDQNTIIVIWGDHGFHLGDMGHWTKHTNYEIATRVPLIVRAPGIAKARTRSLVEFVDVYPTLCELAGLTAPAGLEGVSLVPLLKKPETPWAQGALSQFPRGGKNDRMMGYSLKTDRYRYVEWKNVDGGTVVDTELYDHEKDPHEKVNIAAENAELIKKLSALLNSGWKEFKKPGV